MTTSSCDVALEWSDVTSHAHRWNKTWIHECQGWLTEINIRIINFQSHINIFIFSCAPHSSMSLPTYWRETPRPPMAIGTSCRIRWPILYVSCWIDVTANKRIQNCISIVRTYEEKYRSAPFPTSFWPSLQPNGYFAGRISWIRIYDVCSQALFWCPCICIFWCACCGRFCASAVATNSSGYSSGPWRQSIRGVAHPIGTLQLGLCHLVFSTTFKAGQERPSYQHLFALSLPYSGAKLMSKLAMDALTTSTATLVC